jgi:hypothetical protein
VVGDVRRDTLLRATALRVGLATCLGASTVMPGSEPAEPVGVCDIAVPFSSPIDKIATAGLATKSDENLMAMSSQTRDGHAIPRRTVAHTQLHAFQKKSSRGKKTACTHLPMAT